MKPTRPKKAPPKKRNLAAKALSHPLFRPKVEADPKAYRRVKKVEINLNPDDGSDNIN